MSLSFIGRVAQDCIRAVNSNGFFLNHWVVQDLSLRKSERAKNIPWESKSVLRQWRKSVDEDYFETASLRCRHWFAAIRERQASLGVVCL